MLHHLGRCQRRPQIFQAGGVVLSRAACRACTLSPVFDCCSAVSICEPPHVATSQVRSGLAGGLVIANLGHAPWHKVCTLEAVRILHDLPGARADAVRIYFKRAALCILQVAHTGRVQGHQVSDDQSAVIHRRLGRHVDAGLMVEWLAQASELRSRTASRANPNARSWQRQAVGVTNDGRVSKTTPPGSKSIVPAAPCSNLGPQSQ